MISITQFSLKIWGPPEEILEAIQTVNIFRSLLSLISVKNK